MGARWKGKGSKVEALADPMSNIVSRLKSTLIESDSHGILSGSSVLLAVETTHIELLSRTCFGRPIVTSQKDKQWFQLSLEEAFYLCYSLKCLKIVGENDNLKTDDDLWKYMKSKRENFPILFKAYAHLRTRNWVVRSGSQYGVDFVAYRHHPALVHSEYAVLVQSEEDGNINGRLRVWSDFQCTLRLCGSVAKTLLVLYIDKKNIGVEFPKCLETYSVESRTITRWSPEQSRESKTDPEFTTNTCDPGDIMEYIKKCKKSKIRCSIIGLSAEIFICKHICPDTGGLYSFALDKSHLTELVLKYAPPPPAITEFATANLV